MWIITAWQHISPEVTVKVFKKCCISSAVVGTNDARMLWHDSEGDGNVRSTVRKMKALTVKMEMVTAIGKGRQNLTRSVIDMYKINGKIFFLTRHFIFGGCLTVVLHSDKYGTIHDVKHSPIF
jgi:hypothetical protein